MKRVISFVLILCLGTLLVSCGSTAGVSQSEYDDLERRYEQLQDKYDKLMDDYQVLDDMYDDLYDAWSELYFVHDDSESEDSIIGEDDSVLITHYEGYELFNDIDGSKWIRFNFTFQNNGAEPWSLWQLLYIKVFQDGIEIYRDWPNNPDKAIENCDVEIKDGVSLDCSFAFPVDGEKIQMYVFDGEEDYNNPAIFEEVNINA